jgi:hypothetical protein
MDRAHRTQSEEEARPGRNEIRMLADATEEASMCATFDAGFIVHLLNDTQLISTASRMAKNLSEKYLKLADGAMKIHIQLEEMNNKDAEH